MDSLDPSTLQELLELLPPGSLKAELQRKLATSTTSTDFDRPDRQSPRIESRIEPSEFVEFDEPEHNAEINSRDAATPAVEDGHTAGSGCPCRWYERAAGPEELEAEASKHGINPCLFRVELPAIHGDQEFQGDIVYFALDEVWAHQAPPGAIVYTIAELEALRGSQPATFRLVHVAKRAGSVILETSGTLRRDLLVVATDLGARAAAPEKGETE